jgi:hypothetical protein
MDIGKIKEKFFTENIILAAIPIIAYFAAYRYEEGYFQSFGAPMDLVSVDLRTFVIFASTLLGMWFILYQYISLIWTIIQAISQPQLVRKKLVLFLVALFLSIWILFYIIYSFDWRTPTLIAFLFLLLIVFANVKSMLKIVPKWLSFTIFGVCFIREPRFRSISSKESKNVHCNYRLKKYICYL